MSPQSGRTPQTVKTTVHNVDGPNDEGRKFKQVHKVDRSHKRSRLQSTMWTDPMTSVENLTSPQSGRTSQKVKTTVHNVDWPNDECQKFKQVHKVDGPHKGSRLQSTMWTDPMMRIIKQVHKVDGPHEGSRLQSIMWTDPMTRIIKQVHKMDGPNKGSILKSTTWTDPTKIKIKKKKKRSTRWTDTVNIGYLNHQSRRTSKKANI